MVTNPTDSPGPPNRLREWRHKRRFSQAELGKLAGYSQGQIRKLEAGERQLHQRSAAQLAAALSCAPGDLFNSLSSAAPKRDAPAKLSPRESGPPMEGTTAHILKRVLEDQKRLNDKLDRIMDDIRDLKARISADEMQRTMLSGRMDRIEARLDRIER